MTIYKYDFQNVIDNSIQYPITDFSIIHRIENGPFLHTENIKPDIDRLASAAAVVADGSSTRDAAKTYRVDRSTLARYMK